MREIPGRHPLGTMIQGRYSILGFLSKGGSGVLYLVEDQQNTQTLFVLKELIDPLTLEEREGRERLSHRALPRVYQVFDDDSSKRVSVLMEYIKGPHLETLRQQQPEKRFSWPEVRVLMEPIIDAVSYLHRQQPSLLHRDIKPATIILSKAVEKVVLVDFALAREYQVNATTLAVRPCSSSYGAPEQYSRAAGVWTDIYGLGATCYTLLTGRVSPDALYRQTCVDNGEVDPFQPRDEAVASVPAPVMKAIEQAMSLDTQKRFASVEQFWQALNHAASQRSRSVPRTPSVAPLSVALPLRAQAFEDGQVSIQRQPPIQRRSVSLSRKLVVLIALVVLLGSGIGAGSWFLGHYHAAASPPSTISSHSAPPTVSATAVSFTRRYVGTLFNIARQVGTSLSLKTIQQSQGHMRGFITLGTQLTSSGSFSLVINPDKTFQFTVVDATGHPLFVFEGAVQSATSLSGSYYGCLRSQEGQCHRSPDTYGIWNVVSMGISL